jgi:hypothetical protein
MLNLLSSTVIDAVDDEALCYFVDYGTKGNIRIAAADPGSNCGQRTSQHAGQDILRFSMLVMAL